MRVKKSANHQKKKIYHSLKQNYQKKYLNLLMLNNIINHFYEEKICKTNERMKGNDSAIKTCSKSKFHGHKISYCRTSKNFL